MSYMSFCNFNSKSVGRRYDFCFSFNYSSSLSTSESRADSALLTFTSIKLCVKYKLGAITK